MKTFDLLKKEKQELENLLKLHEKKCSKKIKFDNNKQQQIPKITITSDANIFAPIPVITILNNNSNNATTVVTTSSNVAITEQQTKNEPLVASSTDNKFEEDDNNNVIKKNENPMISGQQRDMLFNIERPKNLNLPSMLFSRQESFSNYNIFNSPTFTALNTPTALLALTSIETLQSLASPTAVGSMLTPTTATITSITAATSTTTTTATTTTTPSTLNTPRITFAILKSFS